MDKTPASSFLGRHEFLLRRLHSLTGLVPVGAYMCVHLATNSSILNGPESFQNLVYKIHDLGVILPVVEWTFIFLPILFHGIFGLVIIAGGLPNNSSYPLVGNIRYTLQRASGLVAFAFIAWHVFHMHGWIHNEAYIEYIRKYLNGAQFGPYNAASSAGEALNGPLVSLAYLIGVVACVYHFANGIWTMGLTWGTWTTPGAQRRASLVSTGIGVIVLCLGLGAWVGFTFQVDRETILPEERGGGRLTDNERKWYEERVRSGQVIKDDHKLYDPTDESKAHHKSKSANRKSESVEADRTAAN